MASYYTPCGVVLMISLVVGGGRWAVGGVHPHELTRYVSYTEICSTHPILTG